MKKLNNLALRAHVKSLISDLQGVTAIEYGLIAGLIAVVIIGALTALGGSLSNLFNSVSTSL